MSFSNRKIERLYPPKLKRSRSNINLLKAVLIEIVLVVSLIILCLGVGYEFHVFTGVNTITSLLGFTPGGLEAMLATVMQLGGDTGLVLAMQLTRMLIIIALGPTLVNFMVNVSKDSDEVKS